MDWNIIFFELALVGLLLPVGVSLFVVLTSMKGILIAVTKSIDKVGDNLAKSALQDQNLEHRFDRLEQRLIDKGHLN